MNNKKELEEWKKLYAISTKLFKDKPWDNFEDLEIFCIKLPKQKDKFYCSIMGYAGTCVGISIYKGKAGKECLAAIMDNDIPSSVLEYLVFDSGFYAVYYDCPDLITDYEAIIMEELNLELSTPPYFTVLEKGCNQSYPKLGEVILMREVLEGLDEAIAYFYALKQEFNFEDYLFSYNVEKKSHRKVKLNLDLKNYPFIFLEEDTIEEMKTYHRLVEEWGIDVIYMNTQIPRQEDERTLRPKAIFIEDMNTHQLVAGQSLTTKNEIDEIMEFLFDIFKEEGIPYKIDFRNPQILSCIHHLCEALNIELNFETEFEGVDMINESMSGLDEDEIEEKQYKN